jgi:hypothetical protein
LARAKARDGLTLKEERFVESFMGEAEGNATRAAELAGYKARSRPALQDFARKLAKKERIRAAIAARAAADPRVLTREELQQFWSSVVRGDMFERLTPEGTSVTAPAAMRERIKASELLARTHGMFRDSVGPPPTAPVVIILPGNDREPKTIEMTNDGGRGGDEAEGAAPAPWRARVLPADKR